MTDTRDPFTSTLSRVFVPGTTQVATTPGRTLGPVVVRSFSATGPDVFAAVSGGIDPSTFAGTTPASVATLETFGAIK